jgi:DNA-binding NtrC family response regulator
MMRDSLADNGYHVLDAPHAEQAMRMAQGHPQPIDLLVTDVVLPGIGGPELAARLTAVRPQMSVLYVSGYAEPETAMRLLRHPSVGYLQKPFALDEFVKRVENIVASRPNHKISSRGYAPTYVIIFNER